jgi:hypothetical protein
MNHLVYDGILQQGLSHISASAYHQLEVVILALSPKSSLAPVAQLPQERTSATKFERQRFQPVFKNHVVELAELPFYIIDSCYHSF